MDKLRSFVDRDRLTVVTILGIICGVTIGLILKNYTAQPWSEREIMYLQIPGELFLRMVNCLVLPLIVSSVISASCNLSKSGAIGMKALYYYTLTTTLGIALSVVLVETIRPGELHRKANATIHGEATRISVTTDILLDLLRNLFPDNLVKAFLSQYQTVLQEPENTITVSVYEWPMSHRDTSGTNVLGLVFFSLVFGLALGKLDANGKPLLDFFKALCELTMIVMNRVIMLAPVSVLFLIPGKILQIENFGVMIMQLGAYVLTVFIGLTFHGFVVLPTVYYLCTRKSPYKIISKIGPALVTACGTSSSTATVPMTIRCLEDMGIDPTVARFVAPIGATINMDGIALYETIGAIFIIQMRGLEFSLIKIIVISITCTISCIGAAGLPSGGYVMLILVLNAVGVPSEDVMLIIAIDCLVDRYRTTVNIVSDSLGAGIIGYLMRNELPELKLDEEKQYLSPKCDGVKNNEGNTPPIRRRL